MKDGSMSRKLWALVLAGGEGSRVRHLTTDGTGRTVPKQYSSPDGGESMLRKTLNRAQRVVPRERVAVVVARQHREFWRRELADLPPRNVIVQPRNRGTGLGLLLGVLHIQVHDPHCRLVVLPSDHHVVNEAVLRACLLRAVENAGRPGGRPTLVGVPPERVESGLGWILDAAPGGPDIRPVVGFVEKPSPSVARELAARGALVNSMILAAEGDALVELFRDTAPGTVDPLREHLATSGGRTDALDALYEVLPPCDLSRDVLENVAHRLAVAPAGPCGWTDIGTPDRLSRLLGEHSARACVA
jgi:mannose-1-phosphate guanylyltransferase